MMEGEFGGWADMDVGLYAEYVFGREKARGEGTHAGNGGRC